MARNPLGTCERSEQGAFLSSYLVFRSRLLSSVFNPEGTRERSERGRLSRCLGSPGLICYHPVSIRQVPTSAASGGTSERSERVRSFCKFARFQEIALVSILCYRTFFEGVLSFARRYYCIAVKAHFGDSLLSVS